MFLPTYVYLCLHICITINNSFYKEIIRKCDLNIKCNRNNVLMIAMISWVNSFEEKVGMFSEFHINSALILSNLVL